MTQVLKGPDGALYDVSDEESANPPIGWEPATPQDLQEEEFSGLGNGLAAAGVGAMRAVTGGAYDYFAVKAAQALKGDEAAENVRSGLSGLKEVHPGASMAGELGAGIAAAAFTGGGSVAAAGAGEAAVGSGLAGLAARLAPRVALDAAIGGVYGGGGALSNATLENEPLTAEKLIAGIGEGALFGGGAGAALGLGGEALMAGGRAASKLAGRAAAEARPALENQAGETFFRAAGGQKPLSTEINQMSEGVGAWGNRVRNQGEELIGRPIRNFEDLEALHEAGINKWGAEVEKHITSLDEAAAGDKPKALDLYREIMAHADAVEADGHGRESVAGLVRKYGTSVGKKYGVLNELGEVAADAESRELSYKNIKAISKDTRGYAGREGFAREMSEPQRAMDGLRDKLESRIGSALEEKLPEVASSQTYQTAKLGYRDFIWLEKAIKNGEAGLGGNQLLGLGTKFAAGAGAQLGHAVLGPLGGLVGFGAGAAMNQWGRTRGGLLAADYIGRVAQWKVLARVVDAQDSKVARGVDGFLGIEHTPRKGSSLKFKGDVHPELDQSVEGFAANTPPTTPEGAGVRLGMRPEIEPLTADPNLTASGPRPDFEAPESLSGIDLGKTDRGYMPGVREAGTEAPGSLPLDLGPPPEGSPDLFIKGKQSKAAMRGKNQPEAFEPNPWGAPANDTGLALEAGGAEPFASETPAVGEGFRGEPTFSEEQPSWRKPAEGAHGVDTAWQEFNYAHAGEAPKGTPKTEKEAYKQASTAFLSNPSPQVLQERLSGMLSGLADIAPGLVTLAAAKAQSIYGFLQQKLPKPTNSGTFLQPQFAKERPPSDSEIAVFSKYLRAAVDPSSVLEDMRRRRLGPESVEALRVLYPGIYEEIRTKIMERSADTKRPFTKQESTQLSILFHMAITPDMQGDFIKSIQATHQQSAEPPQQPKNRPSALQYPELPLTTAQEVESKK